MAETPPPPPSAGGPAGPGAAHGTLVKALIALVAVVAGSALLGLIAGFAWEQVAPRAVFVVVGHGTADVVNPETNAFIAADGWFCIVAVVGGVISGLLGYLFAVRRYGPLPMLGVLVGGLVAALVARWLGEQSGRAAFNARLAVARPGALLHAPLTVGAHSALAFWPLAAGVVAGGIEGLALLRERRRPAAAGGYAAAPADHEKPAGGPGVGDGLADRPWAAGSSWPAEPWSHRAPPGRQRAAGQDVAPGEQPP
jgi:hypothetical protein